MERSFEPVELHKYDARNSVSHVKVYIPTTGRARRQCTAQEEHIVGYASQYFFDREQASVQPLFACRYPPCYIFPTYLDYPRQGRQAAPTPGRARLPTPPHSSCVMRASSPFVLINPTMFGPVGTGMGFRCKRFWRSCRRSQTQPFLSRS